MYAPRCFKWEQGNKRQPLRFALTECCYSLYFFHSLFQSGASKSRIDNYNKSKTCNRLESNACIFEFIYFLLHFLSVSLLVVQATLISPLLLIHLRHCHPHHNTRALNMTTRSASFAVAVYIIASFLSQTVRPMSP